jgi:hypothetical protein
MSFLSSPRPLPLIQAFLEANRQFCQESNISGDSFKGFRLNRARPARGEIESLFSTALSSLSNAATLESDSNDRQRKLFAAFDKAPSRRPARNSRGPSTAQSQIVAELTRLIGDVANIRRDAAADLSGIGASITEIALSFDQRQIVFPAEDIESQLSKLQHKCKIDKSADPIREADDDDFIVIGDPPVIAVDALLVDEDVSVDAQPEEGEWPLTAEGGLLEGGGGGGGEPWPIMNIETKATGFEVGGDRQVGTDPDEDLNGFWDGLLQSQPAVDPLSALMEAAVEQQLKISDVGQPPSPPAPKKSTRESSRMDEEWTNLQLSLSKKTGDQPRSAKKPRGPRSPPS